MLRRTNRPELRLDFSPVPRSIASSSRATDGRETLTLPQDWSRISGTSHDRILHQGIPLEFLDGQPLAENPPFDSARNLIGRPSELEAFSKTLKYYLEIGAVVRIPDYKVSGLWSTFFPVPKKNTTKVRGCIDLHLLNHHLVYRHFQMEGTHTLQSILCCHDYLTKVDLSDF